MSVGLEFLKTKGEMIHSRVGLSPKEMTSVPVLG